MGRASMSRGDLILLVAVFATAGIGDAAYLTWQWYEAATSSWCDFGSFFSCTLVRESDYAAFAGVPTAVFGLVGFVLLLGVAALAFRGVDRIGPWSVDRCLLLLAGIGALLGLGLTYIEVFVITSICLLCVIGFALDLGVLFLAWRLDHARLEART